MVIICGRKTGRALYAIRTPFKMHCLLIVLSMSFRIAVYHARLASLRKFCPHKACSLLFSLRRIAYKARPVFRPQIITIAGFLLKEGTTESLSRRAAIVTAYACVGRSVVAQPRIRFSRRIKKYNNYRCYVQCVLRILPTVY